ncbi:MAG TPA: trypsin-like peptidase domain-containing protein [Streptosporangiaceae bacterium]|nr:trypsin-like peptidase domain-containing protein [Streptosporangiaceae bacterium]
MSQNYDQNPERADGPDDGRGYTPGHPGYSWEQNNQSQQGYPAASGYAGYAGGPGFGSEPPPPRRRNHKRWLVTTAAVALAAGAAVGGLIGSMDHTVLGTTTAVSRTVLSTSQIASRVDPALVDVVSTDGDQQAESAGTGIVLSSNGLILTNNHVINGATAIKVTDIGNGKTYTATVVGYDDSHDVAVLQLQGASGLTVASLGNSSSVQVGDNVVALGNAGGTGGTPSVATGTVTALNQSITASDELSGASEQLSGLIETNADIQPGDSGGSLVNVYGQVIGMDTAASSSSGSQGSSGSGQTAEQAFAIPINSAVSIADQIEAGNASGDIHLGATAFLGVEIGSSSSSSGSGSGSGSGGFDPFGGSGSGIGGSGGSGSGFGGSGGSGSEFDPFGGFGGIGIGSSGSQFDPFGGSSGSGSSGSQGTTSGVSISGVLPGSPVANAGLSGGDTITAVGGQSVSSSQDIANVLVKYHPGQSISVSWVDSSGQSHTSTVTLASGPAA